MSDNELLQIILENQRVIMGYLCAEGRLTSLVSFPEEHGKPLVDLEKRLAWLNEHASSRK